jgi:maleate cis-trans isomerase
MIGWRARIGVLLPADNAVLEYEANRLAVSGVSFHIARMRPLELGDLPQEALEHIPSLKECQSRFILYACAASSFMFGVSANEDLEKKIRDRSGLECATATGAMVKALKTLGIDRVALATPYWRELDERLLAYFKESGIQVRHIESLHLDTWEAMNNQSPTAAYQLAKKADHAEADGLLILSTNLPTLDVLQVLEDDLKKPVMSTNQTMVWAAYRSLGIRDSIRSYGRLLSYH